MFAAATQGYWLVKSRLWESAALLLVAFSLFRPGFWWDMAYPRHDIAPPGAIAEVAGRLADAAALRLRVTGETIDGHRRTTTVRLELGARQGDGVERLAAVGLGLRQEGERVFVDNLAFGTPAEDLRREFGVDFGWEVLHVETLAERPPKQWVYLPALALLGVVGLAQARRRRGGKEGARGAAGAPGGG